MTYNFDLLMASIKYNIKTNPSDFLRQMIKKKKKISVHADEFNEIYMKIKRHYVDKDIEREKIIEKRREEISLKLSELPENKAKIHPH